MTAKCHHIYISNAMYISPAQTEVKVDVVINIDIDLKEISQERADELSSLLKFKGYIPSKAVIRTEQRRYQQMKHRRLFIVNSISAEMLEYIRALSAYKSRTVNYSRDAANDELRKNMVPLTDLLFYYEKYAKMVTTSTDERSSWLTILLAEEPSVEYASLDVPITGVQVMKTHLCNCDYLPTQSCDEQELLQCDKLGVNSCE